MARDIDFENLKEEDYPYLQARSFLVTEAELQGHEGIREKVDAWKPNEEEEDEGYDARQDVPVPPQVTGDAEVPSFPGGTGEEVEEVDYSEASKDELAKEAKRRGLPTSGTKDDLIARLEADDEEEEV